MTSNFRKMKNPLREEFTKKQLCCVRVAIKNVLIPCTDTADSRRKTDGLYGTSMSDVQSSINGVGELHKKT